MGFPTDIFTLNKKNGYEFLKKNYKWPVNDKKLNKIINKFQNSFFILSYCNFYACSLNINKVSYPIIFKYF